MNPKNDKTPLIDTYKNGSQDPQGDPYVLGAIAGPETVKGRVSGTLVPFSPDGNFTYAFFSIGESYYSYTLARDPSSGALTIVSQSFVIKDRMRTLNWCALGSPGPFVYTADGKNGYLCDVRSIGTLQP